jgi:group II intron reverse transcriptase/maturase
MKRWTGAEVSMTTVVTDDRIEMSGAMAKGSDQKSPEYANGVTRGTATKEEPCPETQRLLDMILSRENMQAAYQRVVSNKGAAGIDKMTVGELGDYLRQNWPRIREQLLAGEYQPQAVRKVKIPKASGGTRTLGIPTVLDRLIQQAVHQQLMPIFDQHFSDASYGFRPRRGAQQAVQRAQQHVSDGHRWIVDLDLEKFFDRVNHDILMSRLARKVKDKQVLRLIRRYLQAGLLEGGVVSIRQEGTPQGGPLSPLLSNILLDELDKELERRGHRFCRYADDCNIYLQTKRSAQRVMASVTQYLEETLKLKVNRSKSAVDRPWNRSFLGYSMTFHKKPRLKVAPDRVKRHKAKIKGILRRGRGRNLRKVIEELKPVMRGWINYYRHAAVKGIFEELDKWLRRKLRCILWRQWKRPWTRAKRMMQRGLMEAHAFRSAFNGRGPWWNAGASHMNLAFPTSYFSQAGLFSYMEQFHRFQHTS